MQKQRLINGKVCYAKAYLTNEVDIPFKTLHAWHYRKTVVYHKIDGVVWYERDSIPEQSQKRIDAHEYFAALLYLADGFENAYEQHFPTYRAINKKPEIYEKYAHKHALWERIVEIADTERFGRMSISRMHEIFLRLNLPPEFKRYGHYHAFYRKLQQCRKDIVQAVVDGKNGKKNAQKRTDTHNALIEQYYALPFKLCVPAITDLVNDDLKKLELTSISYESVKKYLQDQTVKNRNHLSRYGQKDFDDTQKAYLPFQKPEEAYELAEMDGLKLPFWCWDKAGQKPIRPILFAIIDVHSGKIIGWSLDETETRWIVGDALRNAAAGGYLPQTIFTDNFSAKGTTELTDLFAKLADRGTSIKYCRVGNAQGKPHIERFFGTFQHRFCREQEGWLGMDIKSKKKDNRPNPEWLKKQTKEKGFPSFEQMRQRVESMLERYHHTKFSGNATAEQRFAKSEKTKAKPISEGEIPFLFWQKTQAKVNRGLLTIEVNKVAYQYPISTLYNNVTLAIRYESADLSQVYAFPDEMDPTHYLELSQYVGMSRSNLKAIGEADRRNRRQRAEVEKVLATRVPHLVKKETLQEAEDELLEECYPASRVDKGLYFKGFVPGASLPEPSNREDDD